MTSVLFGIERRLRLLDGGLRLIDRESAASPGSSVQSRSPGFTVWPFWTTTVCTVPAVCDSTLTVDFALVRPRRSTVIGWFCASTTAMRTERGAALAPLPESASRSAMVLLGSIASEVAAALMPDLSTASVSGPPFFSISDTTGFSPLPGPLPPTIRVPLASQMASTITMTRAAP